MLHPWPFKKGGVENETGDQRKRVRTGRAGVGAGRDRSGCRRDGGLPSTNLSIRRGLSLRPSVRPLTSHLAEAEAAPSEHDRTRSQRIKIRIKIRSAEKCRVVRQASSNPACGNWRRTRSTRLPAGQLQLYRRHDRRIRLPLPAVADLHGCSRSRLRAVSQPAARRYRARCGGKKSTCSLVPSSRTSPSSIRLTEMEGI